MSLTKDLVLRADPRTLETFFPVMVQQANESVKTALRPTRQEDCWHKPRHSVATVGVLPDTHSIALHERQARQVWQRDVKLAVDKLRLGTGYGMWAARYSAVMIAEFLALGGIVRTLPSDPCQLFFFAPATNEYLRVTTQFHPAVQD